VIERRSQAILQLPVDHLPAVMVLFDGTRSDVILFVPAGDDVIRLLTGAEQFLPVIRGRNVCLIARTAIACLSVPEPALDPHHGMPFERQRAVVQLRSGGTIDGELRWMPPAGHQRTADHLNESSPYFTIHADGQAHYVVKAHVAVVEEKG